MSNVYFFRTFNSFSNYELKEFINQGQNNVIDTHKLKTKKGLNTCMKLSRTNVTIAVKLSC
jgi:hypothetical protein